MLRTLQLERSWLTSCGLTRASTGLFQLGETFRAAKAQCCKPCKTPQKVVSRKSSNRGEPIASFVQSPVRERHSPRPNVSACPWLPLCPSVIVDVGGRVFQSLFRDIDGEPSLAVTLDDLDGVEGHRDIPFAYSRNAFDRVNRPGFAGGPNS